MNGPAPHHRPAAAPRRGASNWLLPVIFASGRDDDLPGFMAAWRNEPVLFDDTVIAPGMPLEIVGRTLCISAAKLVVLVPNQFLIVFRCSGITQAPHQMFEDFAAQPDCATVEHVPGRFITLTDNHFWLNWRAA